MSLNDMLHRYCVCCFNPTIDIAADEDIYPSQRLAQTINVPTGSGVDPHPIDVEANQQSGVEQPQVHAISWEEAHHTPVDLEGIDEVNAVVARPADVAQEELYSVSWNAVSKGPSTWGGEGDVTAAWEEGNGAKEAEQSKSLPLPWEGKEVKLGGLVPWDRKTIGPSWEDPRAHLPSSSTQVIADSPIDQSQVKPDDKIDQSQVTTADKSDKSQVATNQKSDEDQVAADSTQGTTGGKDGKAQETAIDKADKIQTTAGDKTSKTVQATELMTDGDNTVNQ